MCILIRNIIGTSISSSKPLKSVPGSRGKRQVGSGENPGALCEALWSPEGETGL